MALAPLATAADLVAHGIDASDATATAAQLAAASAAIRDAANSAITRQVSTVEMWTSQSRKIDLPAQPVHAVTAVTLDGETLTDGTDYVVRAGALYRYGGLWQSPCAEVPSELVVTFEHGLDEVPADIVKLTCDVAGAALQRIADGVVGSNIGREYESIDDYRVGYATGEDATVSVTELPERTKTALRARFGSSGVYVTGAPA